MKRILLSIITGVFCLSTFVLAGKFDAEVNNSEKCPIKYQAAIDVVVTLENGQTFIVDSYNEEVVANTFGSTNPHDWEIIVP